MLIIKNLDDLRDRLGQELAISPWVLIEQKHIDLFAQSTGDDQWIHVDAERAKRESAFGTTIAHGFLTLSLLPELMRRAFTLPPAKMSLNYGLNRVRFPAPVPVSSSLRGRFKLIEMRTLPQSSGESETLVTELVWESIIERQGAAKPVCVAESISRRY